MMTMINGLYGIKIDEPNKMIVIEDLIRLTSEVFYYEKEDPWAFCPEPDVFWIGSGESEFYPKASPLKEDEIDFYVDKIDFNFHKSGLNVTPEWRTAVYEYFDIFAKYLRYLANIEKI